MSDQPYTVQLNNYLQGLNNNDIVDWGEERVRGLWVMTCKVNGVPKGQYTDKHKAVAKEAAAHQALQAVRQGR